MQKKKKKEEVCEIVHLDFHLFTVAFSSLNEHCLSLRAPSMGCTPSLPSDFSLPCYNPMLYSEKSLYFFQFLPENITLLQDWSILVPSGAPQLLGSSWDCTPLFLGDPWVMPASPGQEKGRREGMGTILCCPCCPPRAGTEWNPLQNQGILGREAEVAKLSLVKQEKGGCTKICFFVCFPLRMEFHVNCQQMEWIPQPRLIG